MLVWHGDKASNSASNDGNVGAFDFPNGVHCHGARSLVCSSLTLIKMNEKVWLYLIFLPGGVLGTSVALLFFISSCIPKTARR